MQDPATLEDRTVMTALATPIAVTEPEEISTRQLTQIQLTWIRFRRHKPAMFGVVVLFIILLLAVFVNYILPESPYDQFSYDVTNQNLSPRFSPAWYFMLGTDDNGHTILAQILWGARISLAVGFLSAFGTSLIGIIVGAISGYYSGWVDTIVMRITDVFLTMPFVALLLLAANVFGQGHLWLIIGIFILLSWPGVTRLMRASFLSLREQEFTEAARSVGVSNARIIFRHLLPNALRPVIVATTLNVAVFIVVEAAIDFLGAGIAYPDTSWGNILSDAKGGFSNGNWWWATFPGLILAITVLAVNFIGDGLGDALDVRSKV